MPPTPPPRPGFPAAVRLAPILLLLVAPLPGQAEEAPAPAAAPAFSYALNGLYPLWEGTGYTLDAQETYLGLSHLQAGLVEGFHLGIRPVSFFFRAPNVHAKARVLERPGLSVAAQLEVVVLMRGASEAFTSSNFVSRLDNAESDLTAAPVSLSASWAYRPWLNLHGTATVMSVFGGRTFRTRATVGTVFAVELAAPSRHSLFFHLGEVGYWDHDFTVFGASYRFQRGWFDARLGYFYRLTEEGRQGSPMLTLGARL